MAVAQPFLVDVTGLGGRGRAVGSGHGSDHLTSAEGGHSSTYPGGGKKLVTAEVMISERRSEEEGSAVPGRWEDGLILALERSPIGMHRRAQHPLHDDAAPAPHADHGNDPKGSKTDRRSPGMAPKPSATRSPLRSQRLPSTCAAPPCKGGDLGR